MKAYVVKQYGVPAEVEIQERSEGKVEEGKVLVRMHAAAINQLDLVVRAGYFPMAKQPPLVLGNEGAGVVEAGGSYAPGTRVIVTGGFLGVGEDGTIQESMLVPENYLVPLPETFSFEEGAAFPVAFLTAYLALTQTAQVKAGEWVAVAGAVGTVGNAAIQVARALGAKPVAIVSSPAKADRVYADEPAGVVDLSQEGLSDGVKRITSGAGADVAIDPVGGLRTGLLVNALANGGRAVSIGYTAGTEAPVNLIDLIAKGARLDGFNLYHFPGETVRAAFGQLLAWANEGKIRPHVDQIFPLAQAAEGFERAASGRALGKVILSM